MKYHVKALVVGLMMFSLICEAYGGGSSFGGAFAGSLFGSAMGSAMAAPRRSEVVVVDRGYSRDSYRESQIESREREIARREQALRDKERRLTARQNSGRKQARKMVEANEYSSLDDDELYEMIESGEE